MIRCADAGSRLRPLLDGELEERERRRVLLHLEACPHCRGEYARMQAVVGLVQDLTPEDAPAHFMPALQLRLARHRRERAARRRWFSLPAIPWRAGLAGGLSTAIVAGACALLLIPRMSAAEVARRAAITWSRIRNYGCDFVSQGVYRGQARTFVQRQFWRRPGEFRLDTGQDYPLSTFISAEEIRHYLPGGAWRGRGPLVIVRPRGAGQDVVPFPFGVTAQSGGNVSLGQLIRQLDENRDARLLGNERVGERDCYHLQFTAVPAGATQADRYELWVDAESFLPRRVSWFHDGENHIVTEARQLQVNFDVLPAGTFEFRTPGHAFVIRGDVDPHVFALPMESRAEHEPLSATREEAWARAAAVGFPVLAPGWLPDGYRLVRVRHKADRWVDMHWIREDEQGGRVIKLVQQDAAAPAPADAAGGEKVNLGTRARPLLARLVRREVPYAAATLTWVQGKTRCTLFAAELPTSVLLRLARSLAEVTPPAPEITVTETHGAGESPSALPPDMPGTEAEGAAPEAETGGAPREGDPMPEQPPMMPEMSDEDRLPAPTIPR